MDGAGTAGGAGEGGSGSFGVCGCDGKKYVSEASAATLGIGVDEHRYCEIPVEYFGCGDKRCIVGKEGCYASGDHADCCEPLVWECNPLILECLSEVPAGEPPCGCFGFREQGCSAVVPVGDSFALYKTIIVGR